MVEDKELHDKKFMFRLACAAIIVNLLGLIYGICAHDYRELICIVSSMVVCMPAIYRGLTGLRKNIK